MKTIGDDDPDLVPSFAARTRVRLRGVQMLNDDVAMATVVDDEGQSDRAWCSVLAQAAGLSAMVSETCWV